MPTQESQVILSFSLTVPISSPPFHNRISICRFFGDFLEMDFISCQDGLRLKRFSSPNLLLSSLELCNAYLTVLSRGESLTYYLGEQQSSIFLEERFRTLFCTNPPLLSPWYNQRTNILAWIGLLRHLDPKQLQIDADGICRCRIQEHTIEVSESAYHMLKSGILQEFIQRWPLWGDPQKEIEITEQSIAEASKWHGFALQGKMDIAIQRFRMQQLMYIR